MSDPSIVLVMALAATTLSASVAAIVLALGLRRVSRQLAAFSDDAAGIADAQRRLDARLEGLAQIIQNERLLATTQGTTAGRAYELAARLASGGAGSAQLVASCGLTPAEAELAVRVHRAQRVAGAA